MSEPELDYTPGDFDDPNRIHIEKGSLSWSMNPMEPWERFPRVHKKQPPMPAPNWGGDFKTYLIAAEGTHLVKIGTAKIPEARMAALQTGQPMTLTLLWTHERDVERALHKRFAAHRVRGEWFDLTPFGDRVQAVKAAVEEIEAAQQ
jgi:hypothetical protein